MIGDPVFPLKFTLRQPISLKDWNFGDDFQFPALEDFFRTELERRLTLLFTDEDFSTAEIRCGYDYDINDFALGMTVSFNEYAMELGGSALLKDVLTWAGECSVDIGEEGEAESLVKMLRAVADGIEAQDKGDP